MRVMCKPGSEGGRGGQPPRSTRPDARYRTRPAFRLQYRTRPAFRLSRFPPPNIVPVPLSASPSRFPPPSGYANWCSRRHRRPGHTFQGRFKSELIKDESYFWTVSRYIHLNPVRGKRPLADTRATGPGRAIRATTAGGGTLDGWPITPASKFRMLLHTNPTRERGECLRTRAGASEDM